MENPKIIYLQSYCEECGPDPADGREWSANNKQWDFHCCDCGEPLEDPAKYKLIEDKKERA